VPSFVTAVLFFCVFWAVVGPLVSPKIEERLEWFLLALGVVAVTVSGSWSEAVVLETLLRPMKVCGAILAGSFVFSFGHDWMRTGLRERIGRIGLKRAVMSAIVLVGLSSAFLTTAIAVLVLIELIYSMDLERESEVKVAIAGCFAIGLGGGLTSIAGPIPAITMAKLADAVYNPGPAYLLNLIGPWVLPAIVAMGAVGGFVFAKPAKKPRSVEEDPLTLWNMLALTGRTYVFIAGLVLLGSGVLPFMERFVLGTPAPVLYWANSVSAAIDGATLVSIEINPALSQNQLRHILMGVLIAGGALVTGNAPNLVAAHKLKISAKDWAKLGTPIAAFLMLFYFISLGVWTY
jgi:predicted cation transporter